MLKRITAAFVLVLAGAAASAQSVNFLKNADGSNGLQSWRPSGNASVTDCPGLGKCFSIHQDGFILQDVSLPENSAGMFAVLIGLTTIETAGESPGHPYLYGYLMSPGETMKGTILANLTGQDMGNQPKASGEWVKQSGIFKVIQNTGRIRLFLRSGCSRTSTSNSCVSRFRQPGVFLFSTEDEASFFVRDYQ